MLASLGAAGYPELRRLGRELRRRARRAEREFEARLRWHERRARLAGVAAPDAAVELGDLWARLKRVVVVADLLAGRSPRAEPCEVLAPPRPAPAPGDARVAAAEFLLGRARATPMDLRQKRLDLAAAHELLLRLGSELERPRVLRLRAEISDARRAQAGPGEDAPLSAVTRAAAQRRGDVVWAQARRLYDDALAAGDAGLAGAARGLLAELEPQVRGGLAQARRRDRAASLMAHAGAGAIAQLLAPDEERQEGRDRLGELASELEAERWEIFELASHFGSFFEAEGDEELERVAAAPPTRVPYPTAHMAIDLARSVDEAPSFVVTDPRTIVYDLASERQLVRAWYQPGVVETRRRASVRVYVCDASGSMEGARARFRDAVLIAELNNLSSRAAQGARYAPLYFSFFADVPSDLQLVDSPAKALSAVRQLLETSPAKGKTDITLALEAAFEAIRTAQGKDPHLARATVVLVTDGDDQVDLERIQRARRPVGEVELAFSFLSLGLGNQDLKRLVLEQRAAGRRAFYYHLSDEEIAAGRTRFDVGARTLLPRHPELEPIDPAALQPALDRLRAAAQRPAPTEARALAAGRFPSYFSAPALEPTAGLALGDAVPRVEGLLAAVAEAVALAPAEVRRAEAVELLEHLLRLYRLTTADYHAALARGASALRPRLEALHLLCPPPSPR